MKKALLFLLALTVFIATSYGQIQKVNGRITDDAGNPVAAATVTEQGTATSTLADENGRFSLQVRSGARLVITASGFQSQTVAATGGEMNILLQPSENNMQRVIVTAQGIKRRPRELGYSVAKVNTQLLTGGRSPLLTQALAGKVSGLNVFTTDNSVDPKVKVVLRGYRSLTGSNDALLVIDGIPYASQTSLTLLNPNDIESVTVLKGGQAATLYGSAGVNGALLINTKRGSEGKAKITYTNATNIEQISWLPWMQKEYGGGGQNTAAFGTPNYRPNYLDRMKENWRPYGNWSFGDAYDGSMRIIGRVLEDGSQFVVPYSAIKGEDRKRWDNGRTVNYHVAASGGDEGSTWYLSAENNSTRGIVPGDKSGRTGFRAALTRQVSRLKVGFNAAYTQATYDRTTSNFYVNIMNAPAHIPLSGLRDWRNNKFANPNGYFSDGFQNPYFDADIHRQVYQDANITGNVELGYQVLSWLQVVNRGGIINNIRSTKTTQAQFFYTDWAKTKAYVPAPWQWANNSNGIGRAKNDYVGNVADALTHDHTLNNEFQILASKDIGDFSNKLILGYSVIQQRRKQVNVGADPLAQDSVFNVANRRGELLGGEASSLFRKNGYYADLTTGWKEVVFLHLAYRNDGTSAFYTPDRDKNLYRFSNYGADVSFILTDAVPAIRSKALNYVKLRAAYNKNRNDNVNPFDPYGLQLTYNNGPGFPFGTIVGYTVGDVLPAPDLKPEVVHTVEAGGEFQLFNNRLNLDVTAYHQKSTGQILTVKVSNAIGFPFLRLNVGETKNWGYEADLRYQIIRSPRLFWEVNAFYSYNNNRVVSLYKGINEFTYINFTDGPNSMAQVNVIQGQAFPAVKGTPYVRDPATGRVVVNATNGYPLISTQFQNFGRALPPHGAGLGTRLTFGNFSFAANADYRGGNVVFHSTGVALTRFGIGGWTANRAPHIFPNSTYKDPSGKFVPNTDVPVQEAEYQLWNGFYHRIAENFITPAWFIKLRDVNLSYALPQKWVRKTAVLSGATVGVYGRNLAAIVDKTNHFTDPEFSITTGNGLGMNNTFQTPPVRQYGFNVSISF